MLEIVPSNQFKKDLKLAKKRGYKIEHLREVINTLACEQKLDEKYRDHGLTNNYSGFRECHIEPDWLLIYRVSQDALELLRGVCKMNIEYKTQKDLPCDELYQLFLAVGWATEAATTQEMLEHFNIGFLHSTFVFSAWVDGKLVGCIRALSDLHFRSVIYDLAVLPAFQNKGIGRELVRRCRNACEGSEWLVQTDTAKGFYEKIGFQQNGDYFLTIPCKWF